MGLFRPRPPKASIDCIVDGGVAAFEAGAAVVLSQEVADRGIGRMPGVASTVAALYGGSVLLRRPFPLPVLGFLILTAAAFVVLGYPGERSSDGMPPRSAESKAADYMGAVS